MTDLELPKIVDESYVLKLYQDKIDYYWNASRSNKASYKRYRTWTLVLGAAMTLISSLAAGSLFQGNLNTFVSILTPVIAATLTVINGLGQNFHWGATWRDMVVNATRLEMERDRFLATPQIRDCEKELANLNGIILEETKSFFQRVLESEIKPKDQASG